MRLQSARLVVMPIYQHLVLAKYHSSIFMIIQDIHFRDLFFGWC